MKTLELYRNNKGIVIKNKYHFGNDGKNEFHYINNKDIFYIHLLKFHFFYLKNK